MGLLQLFQRGGEAAGNRATSPVAAPTAATYVDWLLQHMLRSSQTVVTIDTTRPLPGDDAAASDSPPPCIPAAESAINRLKILCGLNPIRQSAPVEGRFEQVHGRHALLVAVRFIDQPERSLCTLRMAIRGR